MIVKFKIIIVWLALVILEYCSYANELKLDDLFPENRLIEVDITISY